MSQVADIALVSLNTNAAELPIAEKIHVKKHHFRYSL
jgi:hypothetical protein